MRNLLNFLIKYNYWFLFLLLEVASFILLFRFNHYQQSVYFTSANGVAGKVYEISGGITSYFHLKTANEDLLDRNMWLAFVSGKCLEGERIGLRQVVQHGTACSYGVSDIQGECHKEQLEQG